MRCVVDEDRDVFFLDANNEQAGFTTLEEAQASGRPFVAHVRRDVLALDVDRRDQHPGLQEIIDELHDWGVDPVVVASGQPDHLHLFAWLGSEDHCEHLRTKAERSGIDVRRSGAIRPPMSPHRLGLPSRLISHQSDLDALIALTTLPASLPKVTVERTHPDRPLRPSTVVRTTATDALELSPRVRALLRDGDVHGRYSSGSEVVQAILTEAARRGWTYDQVREVMEDPDNLGAEAYRKRHDRSPEKAENWLEHGYVKALGFVDAEHQSEDQQIDLLRSTAGTWTGTAAPSRRAVYGALLDISIRCCSMRINASIRELVEATGLARGTVRNALSWLQENEHVLLEKTGAGTNHASTYVLTTDSLPTSGVRIDPPLPHPRSLQPSTPLACTNHDLWANRLGLGKYSYQIYSALLEGPRTLDSLVAAQMYGKAQTVRKHLGTLERLGLVEQRSSGGWEAVPLTEEEALSLAEDLGSAGRAERIAATHARERSHFRNIRRGFPPSRGWAGVDLMFS